MNENVEFSVSLEGYPYDRECKFCNSKKRVLKLNYPVTVRINEKDEATTDLSCYICNECRKKIIFALEWPDDSYEEAMKDVPPPIGYKYLGTVSSPEEAKVVLHRIKED